MYRAKIRKVDGVFVAEFPDVPGCTAQGRTKAEAKASAVEALVQQLDSMLSAEIEFPYAKFTGGVAIAAAGVVEDRVRAPA